MPNLTDLPQDALWLVCTMLDVGSKSLVRLARASPGLHAGVAASTAAWVDVDCSRVLSTADDLELMAAWVNPRATVPSLKSLNVSGLERIRGPALAQLFVVMPAASAAPTPRLVPQADEPHADGNDDGRTNAASTGDSCVNAPLPPGPLSPDSVEHAAESPSLSSLRASMRLTSGPPSTGQPRKQEEEQQQRAPPLRGNARRLQALGRPGGGGGGGGGAAPMVRPQAPPPCPGLGVGIAVNLLSLDVSSCSLLDPAYLVAALFGCPALLSLCVGKIVHSIKARQPPGVWFALSFCGAIC